MDELTFVDLNPELHAKESLEYKLSHFPTGTEARVCADIAKRQKLGVVKYNSTVEGNPLLLRDWLQHAYCECLDQAIYLKRAMEEIDK